MMVNENTALHETAFTVSIDLIGKGCTTGISAHDRATCIRALVSDETRPEDFAKPGHIFPLRAKTGGVLRRSGHTEAAIDLARLAGYKSVGVLVEILNADGSMARLPQLVEIAREHDLKIISIKDLISYRMERERIVEPEISLTLDSHYGPFEVRAYKQITNGDIHLAFIRGDVHPEEPTLVRVHSTSETGDILGRLFDEYGAQLKASLEMIAREGKGVLLYMRHSEKGTSIVEKLKEYANSKAPSKTSEQRDFGVGAQILRDIGIRKIRLLTNRPRHRVGLIGFGLEITENVHVLPGDC
jgi:3,4-dihydroxy 2-butanone 4-phosphate synthase/GTP cyclohydrolase II